MKLNQNGFGVVEGLLIFVIVAIVGGVGFYVYRSGQDNPEAVKSDSQQTKQGALKQEPERIDATANWLVYTSPDNEYSIKIPDGWKLQSYRNTGPPYSKKIDNLSYEEGDKATISSTDYAGDNYLTAFGINYYGTNDYPAPKGTKTTLKTNEGVEVIKYVYTYEHTEEFDAHPVGSIRYEYRLVNGTKTLSIAHDVLKGEEELSSLVEKSVKTIKF